MTNVVYNGPIVTRAEATAAGTRLYFTRKPCPIGHIAQRQTKSGRCAECLRIYMREYLRAYVKKNPERRKAIQATYRAKNADKIRQDMKERRRTQRDAFRKYHRKWAIKNPDTLRASKARRRAREAKAEGNGYTALELKQLLTKQRWKCVYCNANLKRRGYHADHRTPLAKGGANTIRNIQMTCPTCNQKKSARDPIDYALELGRLL